MSAPVLPGFRYLDHLGSGGFADVFLYEQQWPQQRVAVKVVRPDVPLTEREKQLFTAEANAMARLADHPYIVSVITAGVTPEDGRPFLVMRYCPPPDLGVRVRQNPMRVADAVSTGIKLASAIETAHRSGILHRDIKPSNVLVTTYHEPALTDFGIAGHIAELDGESEVRISYPWSPPELLDGRSNGTVASDVYSLGATIWHLLVGRSPFSIPNGDNSTRALSARILHSAPPSTQRSDVPPALDRLLQQCLAKQPGHRPQSAMELAQSLQRIEAAAGWPRTSMAVEGGRPDAVEPPPQPVVDIEPTVMKARSVVSQSQSGRRSVVGQDSPAGDPGAEAEDTGRRGAVLWAVLGVLAAVAVVVGLVLGDGERDRDPGALPTEPTTPASVLPEAPPAAPAVEGERTARGALFRWSSPEPLQPGDQWVVDGDTGQDGVLRTDRRRLLVDQPGEVCVQVTLLRGSQTSAPASACVPAG